MKRTIEQVFDAVGNLGTADVEQLSYEAESQLRARAKGPFGSAAAEHAADLLKAQRKLVTSKDLGDRFMRIAQKLEEIKENASGDTPAVDLKKFQQQMESVRPLLRLIIRSQEFRSALMSSLKIAKNALSRNVKEVAEKVAEDGLEAIGDVYEEKSEKGLITDEEWEKLSGELESWFSGMQSHKNWRSGIDQLFSLASMVSSSVEKVAEEVKDEVKENDALQEVKDEAKDLVAQFSGEKELEKLINSISKLAKKFEKNDDASKWWEDFKEITTRVAKDYRGKEDIEKYRELFQTGYDLLGDFQPKLNDIIDNMSTIMTNIAGDECVVKLQESLGAISDDLFWQDKDGNRYVDRDSVGVLVSTITDMIRSKFQGLPLPRVDRTEKDMSYSFDNLSISATLPDKIDFHVESYASVDTAQLGIPGQSYLQTEIYLTASIKGITVDFPNINFTYNSSTFAEAGVMSISIPEPGADLTLEFVMRPMRNAEISALKAQNKEAEGFQTAVGGGAMRYEFVKISSHFTIHDMQISYEKDTLSHPTMVPLLTRWWKSTIIDRFETEIEQSLNQGLEALGQQVVGIMNNAQNPLSISSLGSLFSAL